MKTKPLFFLVLMHDRLDESVPYASKAAAVREFRAVARELARYGHGVEASIHVAGSRDELNEYPNWVLSVGVRGGIVVEVA